MKGGSYVKKPDGSLECVEQTAPAPRRSEATRPNIRLRVFVSEEVARVLDRVGSEDKDTKPTAAGNGGAGRRRLRRTTKPTQES